MTETDHVAELAAFCEQWLKYNEGGEVIDHGFGPDHGSELTVTKLRAVLGELEQLRADLADLKANYTIRPRRKPAECGTRGGYYRHLRAGEQACTACRAEHSRYQAQWKSDQRSKARDNAESAPRQPERGGEER